MIPLPLGKEITKLIVMLAYHDVHKALEKTHLSNTLKATVVEVSNEKTRYALVMESEDVDRKATVMIIEDSVSDNINMCISLHEPGEDATSKTVKSKIVASIASRADNTHVLRMLSIIGGVRYKWNCMTHAHLLSALKIITSWEPTRHMVDIGSVSPDFEDLYESPPIVITE